MATCPLCNRELGPTDRLVMEYYPPKDWWVFNHYNGLPQVGSER